MKPQEQRGGAQGDLFRARLDQIISLQHALVKLAGERAGKVLRKLKTYLGRTIRNIARKIARNQLLKPVFAKALSLSHRVLTQRRRQKAPKVYSLHAPEVERIGKGKAHKPYEFGVKLSLATTLSPSAGGQFILHAKALPGNPYDGHTLESVIPDIEATTGATVSRILADAGYKGHNAPAGRIQVQGKAVFLAGGA